MWFSKTDDNTCGWSEFFCINDFSSKEISIIFKVTFAIIQFDILLRTEICDGEADSMPRI
jgi:hypothetical protein